MVEASHNLGADEKSTQVMMGTSDMLLWGDLVTKAQVRLSGFLNTLAEEFVPLHNANLLFLAPVQQMSPVYRSEIYVKLEEILFFYGMSDSEPLPEESEVRQYEPVEMNIGSFQIDGMLLKSPIATLQNMLIVSRNSYLTMYKATIRHVAKPWLGALKADAVQVRRDRLIMAVK